MSRRFSVLLAAISTFVFIHGSVQAQKSKDTLRIGLYQPISIIDDIFDPHPQTAMMDRLVFDNLLNYDSDKREYLPGLALSWKRIDATTVEMKLRQDVTFTNGDAFDADDVVYTFAFVMDPNVKFRFKDNRFGIFAPVEKIDKYTVRIKTKKPDASLLSRLTTVPPILPSRYHSKLANKASFGRNPIGSGPYKVEGLQPGKGLMLVKNPLYKHGNIGKPEAKISRIEITEVPDGQTQLARMMTNQQDLMYNVPKDAAEYLSANPDLAVSVRDTIQFVYFIPDAANRSKVDVFKNEKIREAVFHAINRKEIAAALLPAGFSDKPLQQSMCHPWHIACSSSVDPAAYDLAKAKALMKEGGYPNGFKLAMTTWGVSRNVAEAISGQLRKIGIQAAVDNQTMNGFVKKRAAGAIQVLVALWDNGGGAPDVTNTASFFFLPGSRDYGGDKSLAQLVAAGDRELDPEKRKAIYRTLFDTVTKKAYALPVIPIPAILAHRKEVKVPVGGTKKPEGFMFNLLEWQ